MKTFIQGRVIDAADRGVADVSVYLVEAPGSHPDIALLSGQDGEFALPAVTVPGTYRIGANGASGQGLGTVVLCGSETHASVEIRLETSTP